MFVGGGGGVLGAWFDKVTIQQLRVQTFGSSMTGGLEVKVRVPFFGH